MNKSEIIDTAKRLITGDRAEQYGDFETQMASIAMALSACIAAMVAGR